MKPNRQPPTLSEIEAAVCSHYGLTREDLRSRCRKAHLVNARQLAMYLARECTAESRDDIGAYFGWTRSSVDYSHRQIKGFVQVYPAVRGRVNFIIRKLSDPSVSSQRR